MTGLRLVTNSLSSIEVLTGFIQDMERQSRIMTVEINGRLSEKIKLFVDMAVFSDISSEDNLYDVRDDDYVSMELRYYF
jgi:hypothetical protein